jgi:hypothetical protein
MSISGGSTFLNDTTAPKNLFEWSVFVSVSSSRTVAFHEGTSELHFLEPTFQSAQEVQSNFKHKIYNFLTADAE